MSWAAIPYVTSRTLPNRPLRPRGWSGSGESGSSGISSSWSSPSHAVHVVVVLVGEVALAQHPALPGRALPHDVEQDAEPALRPQHWHADPVADHQASGPG